MEHNNQTYHLLYNHQGSLRAVVDSNGTIVKEVQYDAFGNITLDTNSALHVNFGFAGGLYDTDTKLTRFGYRDYDAQTGKWTAKDPIGFQGGDTNLYGYVLQDPVNFVDPRGLDVHCGIDLPDPLDGMPYKDQYKDLKDLLNPKLLDTKLDVQISPTISSDQQGNMYPGVGMTIPLK